MTGAQEIEKITAQIQGNKHCPELQSIRGIAALVVAIFHCTFYYNYNSLAKKCAEVILNAHASVIIFFVLSGFVLAMSLVKSELSKVKVVQFYLRRCFRIYPALWLSILFALVYVYLFNGHPLPALVSNWWPEIHRDAPSLFGIVKVLLGFSTSLPIPVWTLFIEIVGSFILPFAAYLMVRNVYMFSVCVIGALLLPLFVGGIAHNFPLYFCGILSGAALALLVERYRCLNLNQLLIGVIASLSFLLLWFGRHFVAKGYMVDYGNSEAIIIEVISASILIATVYAYPKNFSFLRKNFVVELGDISYSLYLLHMPVLAIVSGIWTEHLDVFHLNQDGFLSTLFVTMITIFSTVILSRYSYRYVEVPMIRIGKSISLKLTGSKGRDKPITFKI